MALFGKRALALFASIGVAAAAEFPAGAMVTVRLKTKLSSATAKPGDTIEAVVIQAPISGAIVSGKVKSATSLATQNDAGTDSAAATRAHLAIEFGEIATKTRRLKIDAKLAEIDNARETITDAGEIDGIVSNESLSAKMDAGLEKLGNRGGLFADLLRAAKTVAFKPTDAEISYEPGVDMTLKLVSALQVDEGDLDAPASLEPVKDLEGLSELVNAQPFQTVADSPPKPSDVTNLMLVGSREQIENAFQSAGWSLASGLSKKSKFETVRAVVEDRGYKEAPMSILRLDGQAPEMAWERMNNTFAKRHHLRVFRRPGQWDGKDIWVSSSTHDTGIDFSPRDRNFIHKIDSKIDSERDKVVMDLVFTGMVRSTAVVDRPLVPKEGMNATGDKLLTDGRMTVVIFR